MNKETVKNHKVSIFHPTRFSLILFYSIASFCVIVIVSFSVGKIFTLSEKRELIERSETYAGFIINNLNYAMYKEFFYPVMENDGQIDLENNPEHFRKLDQVIKKNIYGYNIKKVYLYDYNRQVIYSTIPKHIGFVLEPGANTQLDSALNGASASILRPPGELDYRSEVVEEPLLESYYPIYEFSKESRQKAKQVGAMEIYQDMTGLNKQISAAYQKTTIITASSMGVMFISLLLIVYKGSSIIKLRTKQLKEIRDQLEERVKERTQEIETTYYKLRKTQKKLIQSEKMAGIGKLAAGIAHEINNPLASVASCAEGLQERFNASVKPKDKKTHLILSNSDFDTFQEYLKIIYNETFRCKAIISKLLNFSRQTESVKIELDLNNVLRDSLLIIKHQIDVDKKSITLDLMGEPAIIIGDEHQLKQVFLNVIKNASESIDGKGEIIIKSVKKDDCVSINFKDNGSGIKKEDLAKIFDPFFTTKPADKGTGLGLSICYGIIEVHGGNITAFSDGEGRGSTIEITLPLKI